MKWKEIVVNTDTEGSELVSDAFFSIGCSGVKIVDKNDILDIIKNGGMWDYIDEECLKNAPSVVKVSGFVSENELDSSLKKLCELLKNINNIGEITVTDVDDESWYDNWKKYYSPIVAGNFVVIPKWLKYDNKDKKTEILIDPGMAFGTGEHESTKMCLILMSKLDFSKKDVIDVGTGSGILGIGAKKSGAKSCYMCDLDSVAVKAAQENSSLNKLDGEVEIELADLLSKNRGEADVVLANLTADILIRLSKDIGQFLRKSGMIICSGIIHKRRNDVVEAFVTKGYLIKEEITMGEWVGIAFEK